MNKKKLIAILAAIVTCAVIVAGVAWFQMRPASKATADLADGVTATAEAPSGTNLRIEAVQETTPLQKKLPKPLKVLASGDFHLDGDFPKEGVSATFDVGDADPKTNYVVGYLDEKTGRWEFTKTTMNEQGKLAAMLPHFSVWSVVSGAIHGAWATVMGPDVLAMQTKPADCTDGDDVPPWAVHLENKVETDVLTWCSQADESGNLVLRVVNNNPFPLPLELPVEPDKASVEEDGETIEHPYVRLKNGALVLPALSGVDLTFSEATFGETLRNEEDWLRLVYLDDDQVRRFAGVDTMLDLISVPAWGVSFISAPSRAGMAAILVETASCESEDVGSCLPAYQDAAISPLGLGPDFVGGLGAGNWGTNFVEKHLNPSGKFTPQDIAAKLKESSKVKDLLLTALSYGTLAGQVLKYFQTKWYGGQTIDLHIQRPYLDYLGNYRQWTAQKDPHGYVTFDVRNDWKIRELPLEGTKGYGFIDGEGSILSIANKDGVEIAQFITGMTALDLETLMRRDPESGEPLLMNDVDFKEMPQLDGKRSKDPIHEYGDHAFRAYTLHKEGSSKIIDVGAGIANGAQSRPYWQFSQSSYGIFTTPPLAKDGVIPSHHPMDRFGQDPLFFELKRMMTSLRFTDKREPGAVKQPEPWQPPESETATCDGSRFSYEGEMTTADCTEAKSFVEKVTVDENIVSKGWVSATGEGGCMAEPGVKYEGMDGMTCRMPGGRTFVIHMK